MKTKQKSEQVRTSSCENRLRIGQMVDMETVDFVHRIYLMNLYC